MTTDVVDETPESAFRNYLLFLEDPAKLLLGALVALDDLY